MKDNKDKLPKDYDNNNKYTLNLTSLWSCVKIDDYILVSNILKHNSSFYNINSQANNTLNTPIHIGIINQSLKSLVTIFDYAKNNNEVFDISIKNNKNQTIADLINLTPNKFIQNIFNKIINNEITSIFDLEDILNKKGNINN